jgi:hypothetical protein
MESVLTQRKEAKRECAVATRRFRRCGGAGILPGEKIILRHYVTVAQTIILEL